MFKNPTFQPPLVASDTVALRFQSLSIWVVIPATSLSLKIVLSLTDLSKVPGDPIPNRKKLSVSIFQAKNSGINKLH